MRRRVLREEPLCRACGERSSVEVDHIVPLHRGGSLMDRANLQGLCVECHQSKDDDAVELPAVPETPPRSTLWRPMGLYGKMRMRR